MSLGSYFFLYCTLPCVLYFSLDVYRSTLHHTVDYFIRYLIRISRYVTLYFLTQSILRLCMLCRTRALPALHWYGRPFLSILGQTCQFGI